MEKLVNGLTFEEIFDQRGEKIIILTKGEYYLTENAYSNAWICRFDHFDDDDFWSTENLSINGCYFPDLEYEPRGTVLSVYKATEDQIALLNAYKNE